jgi:iron complex outermembrane recepter protein
MAVATGAIAQTAPAANEPLPPVVVEGAQKQPKKKAATKKSSPATTAAAPTPAPVPQVPPATATSTAESSSSPLYADPGPGPNLDAQNTTGSRLGITPLQTPASVDVISGQTARDRGQRTITEAVTQNAPGFTSVAMPVLGSVYAARGFQGTNSVMQLYDGTRLFPGRGNVTFPFNTWSVERIEVLHGPASVLYGDGAIGGVINVIPKKPITNGMFNEAEIFFDSNNTRRVSFDSSAAVTRDLAYRVNVSKEASDGWIDNGDSENLGISGAVRAQVSDSFVVSISHDYGEQEPMKYFGTPYKNGVFDPRTRDNNYNVANALTEFRDQWTQVKTEWQATDQLTLRNVAYMLNSRREFRNAEDYLWGYGFLGPIFGLDPDKIYREGIHIRQKQEQVGNRFDATLQNNFLGVKTESVVGFDVNRGDYKYANYVPDIGEVDPVNPVPGLFPDPDRLNPKFDSQLDQHSLFAETRVVLSEQFSVVGGVRWDHSSLSRVDHEIASNTFDGDFDSVNWRGGAVFTPVRNLAFYGQYSVASDPLNVPLLDYAEDISNLKLTKGRQIEVGVKQSLFDGAFEWSLAAYEIVKTDLLFRDTSTQPNTLQQIGQQSSRGVEAAVGIVLGSGWRVDANGALLRANYDDFKAMDFGALHFPPYVLTDYSGNVPALIPERTGNVWVTWDFAPSWSANAGVQYVGESFANIANTVRQPAYTVTNAGLQWKATESATLDFRVRNVFDKLYVPYTRVYTTDDSVVQGWIAPPRTFEAALRYKF